MPESSDLASLISLIASQHVPEKALDGVIVPGSYDAANGLVDVLVGDTVAIDPASPDGGPLVISGVQLGTSHIGHQGAPLGNERVILIHRQSGYLALLEHGQDDSPGAAPGELWMHLRSMDPARSKSVYIRVQNDAVRINHLLKTSITSPVVNLATEQGTPDQGVVRQSDLQKLSADLTAAFQNALNNLARTVQSGPGVPVPQVTAPTAVSSAKTYSA